MINDETVERFWPKVDKSGDCWVWLAAKDRDGYGKFSVDGAMHLAHRVAFCLENGRWPVLTRHLCNNPACVNPRHLAEGTQVENSADRLVPKPAYTGIVLCPSKLPADDKIAEGKLLRQAGASLQTIASKLGLTQYLVRRYIAND